MRKLNLERVRDVVKVTQTLDLKAGSDCIPSLGSAERPAQSPLKVGCGPQRADG